MPCIAFIVQDTAEADELALHYSTWNCSRVCRICDLPRESRHLAQLGTPRTTNETRTAVRLNKPTIDAHRKGARGDGNVEAKKVLKDLSVHALENAWWPADFGECFVLSPPMIGLSLSCV